MRPPRSATTFPQLSLVLDSCHCSLCLAVVATQSLLATRQPTEYHAHTSRIPGSSADPRGAYRPTLGGRIPGRRSISSTNQRTEWGSGRMPIRPRGAPTRLQPVMLVEHPRSVNGFSNWESYPAHGFRQRPATARFAFVAAEQRVSRPWLQLRTLRRTPRSNALHARRRTPRGLRRSPEIHRAPPRCRSHSLSIPQRCTTA